ncbi:hypothetical protein C8R45DRAFT_939579 [Mycena sanguinolenta]|nr:hypothetical protein C8R45DRAFT_939579 [Mycena sanguinolenta]
MLTTKIRPNAPDRPTAKAAEKILDIRELVPKRHAAFVPCAKAACRFLQILPGSQILTPRRGYTILGAFRGKSKKSCIPLFAQSKSGMPLGHKLSILREDETCHEDSERGDEEDGGDKDEDDSDASSDSDSEDEQLERTETFQATQNIAALGEQAVSRAVFELEDRSSSLADLGTHLDHRVTGLSPEERAKVDKGYGQLIDFISKLQRIRDLLPPSSILPASASLPLSVDTPSSSTSTTPAPIPNLNKRKRLLPVPSTSILHLSHIPGTPLPMSLPVY